MSRSPLALAALSTLAVPGLDVHHVQSVAAPDGFDSAVAIDAEKRRWVVRAPSTLAAGAALEAESAFLSALEDYVDSGRLPFEVPRAAGFAPLPDGGRAIVYPELPGHPLRVERIVPGPGISASLGRAIAALHELPVALVESSGHPVYSAEEYRQRRLSEVDEAARTGKVPATLLRRWEHSLEDVSMWRFRPTVTHTGLSAETLLVRAGQISAITDFFEVQVGDPADDLSWLLVTAPQESVESILEAYQLRRTELIDPHLVDRALLASELALARWLLHGVRNDDATVVADAVGMLRDLDRVATEVGAFSVATASPQDPGPRTGPTASTTGATGATPRRAGAGGSAGAGAGAEKTPAGGTRTGGWGRRDRGAQGAGRGAGARAGAAGGTGGAAGAGSGAAAARTGAAAGTTAGPGAGTGAGVAAEVADLEGVERIPDYDRVLPRPLQDVDTTAYATVGSSRTTRSAATANQEPEAAPTASQEPEAAPTGSPAPAEPQAPAPDDAAGTLPERPADAAEGAAESADVRADVRATDAEGDDAAAATGDGTDGAPVETDDDLTDDPAGATDGPRDEPVGPTSV